jgi:hypothetical protein
VAAINPEFYKYFLKLTQHSWKSSDFIKIKTHKQRNILRIGLFNEIAVSSDDSLTELDLNLLQAMATGSLSMDSITSMIFGIKYAVFCEDLYWP